MKTVSRIPDRRKQPAFLKVTLLILLISGVVFQSKNYGQIAPVNPPAIGFNIDGTLQANGINGDWLAGSGTCTAVLKNNGTPYDQTKSFFITDPYNSGSDIVFKDGSMAFDYIDANLTWNTKSAPDKDDIAHGLFHISKDGSNNTWIIMAG